MKPFTVHTRYLTVGGMLVVHAYGPYTQSVARRRRKEILASAVGQGFGERVTVHVCELMDPENASPFAVEYRP